MPLEVDELGGGKGKCSVLRSIYLRQTHLSPGDIGCDDKVDVTLLEYTENRAPEVPLGDVGSRLEELCGPRRLAAFIAVPGLLTVLTSVGMCMGVRLSLVGGVETREDKDRLDVQLFERAQVGLDFGGEREG